MKRLRKFFSLEPDQRRFLVQSCFAILGFRVALRVFAFRKLVAWVDGHKRRRSTDTGFRVVKKIGWAVDFVGDRFGATCLERALAAQFLMGRKGYWVEIRIGVKPPESGILKAHAWIEYRDHVIIGGTTASLSEYTTLPDLGVQR